jgi:hypothetical protein
MQEKVLLVSEFLSNQLVNGMMPIKNRSKLSLVQSNNRGTLL